MTKYLFRAEAVNLTPTVYDTSDISTIRGGGFYLLNRVGTLAQHTAWKNCLITEGASSAVFAIETVSPDDVRKTMLEFLYSGSDTIKEMMFLVEYMPESDSFPTDMARLMGKIRCAQMQSPSIRIFPETIQGKPDMTYDALNGLLPAQIEGGNKGNLSRFTHNRRDQGKKLRQKIYREVLGPEIDPYEFTDDIASLSRDASRGNLNGKIAYIYIDGNKFGALQRSFSKQELKTYDNTLQALKRAFLQEIINLAQTHPSFLNSQKEIRMETLLWGGDEIKLIVPAWLGMETASLFYRVVADQAPHAPEHTPSGAIERDLTYAMGLVFAHHKNPIQNIDSVACKLVDAVKYGLTSVTGATHPPQYDKTVGNRMQYMVLESLETLPSQYARFAREYYKTGFGNLGLTAQDMDGLKKFAAVLLQGISRSWLYGIAKTWSTSSSQNYVQDLQRAMDVSSLSRADKTVLAEIIQQQTGTVFKTDKVDTEQPLPEKGYRWLQVVELLDYLT